MSADRAAADPRIPRAEAILARAGLGGTTVHADGHEREIAVLRARSPAWERLLGADGQGLAEQVKQLGFRYVAVDLAAGD